MSQQRSLPEQRSYAVRPAVPIVGRSRGRLNPPYHFLSTFLLALSRRPTRITSLTLSRTLTKNKSSCPKPKSQCRRSFSFTAKACPGEAGTSRCVSCLAFRCFSPPLTLYQSGLTVAPASQTPSLTEHPGTCQ